MRYPNKVLFLLIAIGILTTNAYALNLKIATVHYNPPFEVMSGGDAFGFEISLMRDICSRIQAECEFVASYTGQMGELLNKGEADLAIGAIVITEEKRKSFLFSMPYKTSHVQFFMLKNNPINKVEELKGKTIGVHLRSPADILAKQLFQDDINVVPYATSANMLEDLNDKKIDALLTNHAQAMYWIANDNDLFKIIGPKYPVGEGYGIMAGLDQHALIKQVNQALLDMEKDGTYLDIYRRTFTW